MAQLQATPPQTLCHSRRRSAGPSARRPMVTFRCSASARSSYRITLLPGDGIGPEVVDVAKNVLFVAGAKEGVELRFQEMLMGGAALDAVGVPLPDETLAAARASDGILLGAIGGYKWDANEKHLKPETGLLDIRVGLGVFANLRPVTVFPQLVDASPLKKDIAEGVDIMVVRELTGGIYFGRPRGFGTNDNGEETGFNTEIYSVSEIDRIARVAFEVARKRGGKLCSVDKANVLEASMLWRKRVTAIASEFPDVELSHMYVDNAAMQLVRNPKQFDTIVTNNIFGDILSDEASMITGSIGMLSSASVGESGPGLFEPIHGSAPDIAGQDKANPIATILSGAMLLKYGLGAEDAAKRIETAVAQTLDNGFRTGDIYSPGTPRPKRRHGHQASTMAQLQATPPQTLCHSRRRSAGPSARRPMVTFRCSASARSSYRITLLPGDGIGPEVVDVAKNVLFVAGAKEGVELRFQEMLMGGAALDAVGVPLPDETLAAARASDGILLGAIGGYKWDANEKHLKPETGLLDIRVGLGVFANLRPVTVFPQLVDASPLKKDIAEGVDIMVVRELTGGIYFGRPRGFGTNDNGEETGFNTEIYSVSEIDRIARVAFEVARKRGGKLCSVDKANVLEASMLWRKRVTAIASEFPDVELSHMYVDNAAMQLVRNPKQFDTIVTNNIFGDILSDEASMITGSIGMLSSASVGESGPGLFEPIHGSAPDIAGQDKANPIATILSGAMLLKYGLGAEDAAKRIETAVAQTLDNGFRTGDIYSPGTTLVGCKRMGMEVLKALESHK